MDDGPIHLFLVDPLLSFRDAIAFMLDRESDLSVVGHAGSVSEARQFLASNDARIDIGLVTIKLPDGAGTDVLAELRSRHPHSQVVALTALNDPHEHARAIAAGIVGALHKSCSIGEIVAAVRRLARGESIHPPDELIALLRLASQRQAADSAARAALGRLTAREREILQELARGYSDKEIARKLGVSVNTVAAHMVNLLGKLGVDSRLQAVLLAIKHGAVVVE
jgi:two-component system response regulator DevR